jgi:hypothetical protein
MSVSIYSNAKSQKFNIDWTEIMDIDLLEMVIYKEAHLKPSGWNLVITMFFAKYLLYSQITADLDNAKRRLKARLVVIVKEVNNMIESGNLSAKETSNPTKKYRLVQQYTSDINRKDALNAKDKEKFIKLGNIESKLLIRQDIDSNYSEDSDDEQEVTNQTNTLSGSKRKVSTY